MRIRAVVDQYRRRALEVRVTGGRVLLFPYDRLRVRPSAEDRIVCVAPDPEAGHEAFTYRLASGVEDTVPLDAVLAVNADADYLQQVLLHRLTVAVRAALEERGIGVRAAARQLGTSPTQVYRLLDPAQAHKSLGQLVALLAMADREVEIVVRPVSSAPSRAAVSRPPLSRERASGEGDAKAPRAQRRNGGR